MKNILIGLIALAIAYSCCDHNISESSNKLNDGNKWEVNDDMKIHIIQGEDIFQAYVSEDKSDYKALANELKDQNNKLIESCSMTGQSHDELHKWLMPHLELVDKLGNSESNEEAKKHISDLKLSYQQYNLHFK